MRRANTRILATLMAAGMAPCSAMAQHDRTPQVDTRVARGVPVGHIYYNVATGERVITPYEQRPRSASQALWLNNNADPCGTGMSVGIIDDPDLDGDGLGDFTGEDCLAGTFPCEGSWTLFWGDIQYDSVIDCVVVAYGINAPDLDLDSDSMGDGIVGYDMYITFSDNDNGFGSYPVPICARSCILDLSVPTLPGAVGASSPGEMVVYVLTLDLVGIAPSLIFELGDDNGIDDAGTGVSGGALYGPANGYIQTSSGIDWDSNNLADFSFAFHFDQSSLGFSGKAGATRGANGFVTAAEKLGNVGDLPEQPADASGLYDARDVYSTGPRCSSNLPGGDPEYIGTFFYGGFNCAPGAEIPYSSAYLELYGPEGLRCEEIQDGACNAADLAIPVGTLDFSDLILFLTSFFDSGCGSDIAAPEHVWDFSDVIAFLVLFGEGCP